MFVDDGRVIMKFEYKHIVIRSHYPNITLFNDATDEEVRHSYSSGASALRIKTRILNELGADGWELVSLNTDMYVFKRLIGK